MEKSDYFKKNSDWFLGKEFEEIGKCLVCGEKVTTPEPIDSIVSCPSCGFCWRYWQPTQSTLDDFYKDSEPMTMWSEIKKDEHEITRQMEKYGLFWEFAVGAAKSVLDVGCGNGLFLKRLRSISPDFFLAGIEPNEAARKELGDIKSFTSYDDFSQVANEFDIITMFGVLEHMKDPRSVIKQYSKHLSKMGYFGIIVPNIDSLVVKTLKNRCSTFCQQHLSHFSIKTLSALFEQEGFRLVTYKTAEPETQPILRVLTGYPPYMKNVRFTHPDINDHTIISNDLGYKIAAIFTRR